MVSAQKNDGSTDKSQEDLLAELQETHQRFIQSLVVKKLHVFSISRTAKTPFKAFELREALFYRMTDLSGAAIDLYKQNRIVPSIIIIRAAYETAALCFYVYRNLTQSIEKHDFIEIIKIGTVTYFLVIFCHLLRISTVRIPVRRRQEPRRLF